MKRETIYWILLFGLLVAISWLRTSLNDYNQPFLRNPQSNQYEPTQVGDLYVLKDSTGAIQRFFKVIETTQFGRVVRIAEGKPNYKNNILEETWIRKAIERPIYFKHKQKKVAKNYLINLHKDTENYSIYRLSYPPDERSIALKLYFSPMIILIFVGIIFGFIWIAEQIKFYLRTPYKWIVQIGIFLLFSTLVMSSLSLIQFQINFSNQNSPATVLMTYYYLPIFWNCFLMALITLPFFLFFNYFKRKYIKQDNFADQEFFKFLFILVGGTSYFLMAILLLGFLSALLPDKMSFFKPGIIQFNFMLIMVSEGLIACSIIAAANFLNNLRKHIQQLKFKENLLSQSKQSVLSSQSALDALQARVNPHFLYNSLNSIASLAQTNPAKTEEMALALSDFYKHTTNRQAEHTSTLELEIKQLETYLAIEKIRFGDRLQYRLDIATDTRLAQIPRFLLQPLVENAIKYGFDKEKNQITIIIKAEIIKERLHLWIEDSGAPFSGQMDAGYGLQSVKKKLKLLNPNAHEIHFMNKPVKQVHIILNVNKIQLHA